MVPADRLGMTTSTTLARHVDPEDRLRLPLHRRMVVQHATDEQGRPELRLFHGDKEISFDEPELFAFGEALGRQAQFVARDVLAWTDGQPWPRMQLLLEQLIEAGVLQFDEDEDSDGDGTTPGGARPSPLPPAEATQAHDWRDCEAITHALTGRALEPGYLELVVPIFRVAHMAVDGDGRQVGEANVFPKALRLDVPTNWRACIYPGTRYLDPKPMNVTALKGMRAHWDVILACLARVRAAYLRRYPDAHAGWTLGHVERLATVVLAVPSYALMRAGSVADAGRLHPALASLFRVTDGLRMTAHQMLFIPIGEPTLHPDAPVTSAAILDYAERNFSFHSQHGVCAGPRAMMDDFMSVIVDGRPVDLPAGTVLPDAVESALADMEPALDYGLIGLQAFAATFSLWPMMTRTYERLWTLMGDWQAASTHAAPAHWRETLQETMDGLSGASYLGAEQWRVDRERVYADMYARCGQGLREPLREAPLDELLAPRPQAVSAAQRALLAQALAQRHGAPAAIDAPHVEAWVGTVADYLAQEQAILRVACAVQARINTLLGRTPPQRAFRAADIEIHVLLQGREGRRVPYLVDALQAWLGLQITVEADAVHIAAGG